MKTMRHITFSLVAGMLLACLLPVAADNILPMQSTSAMPSISSTHTAQVKAAYAPEVTFVQLPMQSTSIMMNTGAIPTPGDGEPDLAMTSGPRKSFDTGGETGRSSGENPIGEPWILLLFAAAATGVIAWRRRANKMITDCKQLEEK